MQLATNKMSSATEISGSESTYVRAELQVARPASDVLVFGVVKMAVKNFLRERKRAVEAEQS